MVAVDKKCEVTAIKLGALRSLGFISAMESFFAVLCQNYNLVKYSHKERTDASLSVLFLFLYKKDTNPAYSFNKVGDDHMIKLSELQMKEIIVIENGTRLGHISDLEIDTVNGRILALILQIKEGKSGMFAKSGEMIINWRQITTIGEDVILVQLKENQLLLSNNSSID